MNTWCIGIVLIFSDAVWRQPALQLERELSTPGICVEHIDMPVRYFNRTVVWGAPGYFDRIRHRIPVVRRQLQQLAPIADAWLALFDADIVALRNVGAWFAHTFRTNAQVQLLVQQEWPCNTAPINLCVNGGLWAVRRSTAALALLERAEYLLERLRIPDQDALQIAANEVPPGAVVYLDRQRYANGYTALHAPPQQWSAHGAHAIHVNWLPNVECKLAWLAHFRASRFHSHPPTVTAVLKRCGVSFWSTSSVRNSGTTSSTLSVPAIGWTSISA